MHNPRKPEWLTPRNKNLKMDPQILRGKNRIILKSHL